VHSSRNWSDNVVWSAHRPTVDDPKAGKKIDSADMIIGHIVQLNELIMKLFLVKNTVMSFDVNAELT
jgi:hypothetical protein